MVTSIMAEKVTGRIGENALKNQIKKRGTMADNAANGGLGTQRPGLNRFFILRGVTLQ